MAESDSDDEFETISSQPETPIFEIVPDDKKYKFKFISISAETATKKVAYKLKQGVRLPYTTNSGGLLSFLK